MACQGHECQFIEHVSMPHIFQYCCHYKFTNVATTCAQVNIRLFFLVYHADVKATDFEVYCDGLKVKMLY